MKCHAVNYTIIGDAVQTVEVELNPGEIIIAEASAMNYMNDAIRFETKMGDGTTPADGLIGRLVGAGKRMFSGQSLFLTHFSNGGETRQTIAFSAPCPGKIIPLDMTACGGEIFCQKDAFLCAAYGTRVDVAFARRLGTGVFSGDGFVLQRLTGDGLAFIHAGGLAVEKKLNNDAIKVDSGCIAAFTTGLSYRVERKARLRSIFFGGKGLHLATISGTGTVFLQTLAFSRLADRVLQHVPFKSGRPHKSQGPPPDSPDTRRRDIMAHPESTPK